jgi:hypothetical protein
MVVCCFGLGTINSNSWPDCFSLGWARIAGNRMASKVEIGGVESKLDFRIQPMTEGRIPQ